MANFGQPLTRAVGKAGNYCPNAGLGRHNADRVARTADYGEDGGLHLRGHDQRLDP
jgi:hypothetical protein